MFLKTCALIPEGISLKMALFYTSSGAGAAIDLSFALIEEGLWPAIYRIKWWAQEFVSAPE